MHRAEIASRRLRGPLLLRLVCLLLVCPLLVWPLAAQDPAGRVEGRVDVVEVLLDVLVTGPDGHVIVGLDDDDFVVEENGEPVAIESVSFYSNRELWSAAADEPDAAASVPEERFFVLLFYRPPMLDRRDMALYARLPRAGRSTLDWVARDLLPNDYLAIVSFDGGLNVVQDFTQQPERIVDAVWRASTGKAPKRRWKSRTELAPPEISLAHLIEDRGVRERTSDLFTAIGELARGLAGVRGRKVLALFGADFPSASTAEARRGYRPMVEALNANNVAVYPIDVSGAGRKPTLLRVAEDTGGRYAQRGPDARSALRDIGRENSGFYLLSYRSRKPAGESGYQEVAVRTTNPDLQARARSGYRYGEPAPEP